MHPNSQYATGAADLKLRDASGKDIRRLRHASRLAFERYFDTASRCSGELLRVNPDSTDQLTHINLAILQRREEKAFEAYVKAKASLVEALLGEPANSAANGN